MRFLKSAMEANIVIEAYSMLRRMLFLGPGVNWRRSTFLYEQPMFTAQAACKGDNRIQSNYHKYENQLR